MRYLVNGKQMKQADKHTMEELHISSLELMENAALSCVDLMYREGLDLRKVCIVCGSGNNGGDGFAIARILMQRGIFVTVCFVGNKTHCSDETKKQIGFLREAGGDFVDGFVEDDDYSLIVDAIFGVGLDREIQGDYQNVIRKINRHKAPVLSVDLPSGISADSGQIMGIAVHASITVTFQEEKLGLVLFPGADYAGRVIVTDVGIDTSVLAGDKTLAYTCEPEEYVRLLPLRKIDSHKGSYGKLLVIAGSKGMSGAAYFNALAAYTAGVGLVKIYTHESNRIILQELLPEAIVVTYKSFDKIDLLQLLEWADGVCIGSGLGISITSQEILTLVLDEAKIPCIIDADGLNLISEHRELLEKLKNGKYILTPHMLEMARLLDTDLASLKQNRADLLQKFVEEYQVICALKDTRTMVFNHLCGPYVNLTGNNAMAKAGSGDVLAGCIAALVVQSNNAISATDMGVYLHGRSGDLARKEKGSYSVLARDLISYLGGALKEQEDIANESLY